MAVRIKLTTSQKKDLRMIAHADAEKLSALADHIEALPRELLRPRDLRRRMESYLDSKLAKVLAHHLIGLLTVRRHRSLTVAELVSALSEAVVQEAESPDVEAWKRAVPSITKLLAADIVNCASKAVDLSSDYRQVLQEARVITDIRPIFDDERNVIIGGVVSHLLRVVYAEDNGVSSMSLALDNEDLKQLANACANALKKEEQAKKLLTSQKLGAFAGGDEFSDND